MKTKRCISTLIAMSLSIAMVFGTITVSAAEGMYVPRMTEGNEVIRESSYSGKRTKDEFLHSPISDTAMPRDF